MASSYCSGERNRKPIGVIGKAGIVQLDYLGRVTGYRPVSSNNSRPISQRRISLVPAPIS